MLSGSSQWIVPGRQATRPRFRHMSAIRTVIFLITGKLDFRVINPHVV
jgi:hypothetical protein